MEQAAKDYIGSGVVARTNLVRTDSGVKSSDKIVAFALPGAEMVQAAAESQIAEPAQKDWSSALDLIQEAGEAIRFAEERAAELEQRLQNVAAQAANEMRNLEAQIAKGQQFLQTAEERAQSAEKRALHAEAWLARLHDAVATSFARSPRQIASPHPEG